MSQIDCYEPEFVRHYLSQHPQAENQIMTIAWQDEVRRSLLLDAPERVQALLEKQDAFTLHASKSAPMARASAMPPRIRRLNQAALDIVALQALPMEIRLYCLGVMLSYSEKIVGEGEDALAQLAAMPQTLLQYIEQGVVPETFSQLPSIPQLQRRLITGLGTLNFDWDRLPESPRKTSLSLQLSLLFVQDENSEAMLQQQLCDIWYRASADKSSPWYQALDNYLIYRLYHDVFPWHESQPALRRFLLLMIDYFMLRSLFSLWVMDGSPLDSQQTAELVALFEQWRHCGTSEADYQQLLSELPADETLIAFSLLTR